MKGYIEIDGKHYISSSRAAEISKYSKDYIGQLCRARKIDSVMMGRSWYVNESALLEYKKIAEEALQERYHEYAVRGSSHINSVETTEEPSAFAHPSAEPVIEAAPEPVHASAFAPVLTAVPAEAVAEPVVEPALALATTAAPAPVVVPPLAWKITYEADDRPLLPTLEKKQIASAREQAAAQAPAPVKSPFMSELERIASTAAMVAVLGIGSLYATNPSEFNSSASALGSQLGAAVSTITSGIASIPETASVSDAIASVRSFFSNAVHNASVALGDIFGASGSGSGTNGTTTLATNGQVGGSSTIAFEDYPYYPGPFAAASSTPSAASIASSLPNTNRGAIGAAGTVYIREAAAAALPQLTLRDVDARIQQALAGFQPWHPTYTFISTQSSSDVAAGGAAIGQSIGAALTSGASSFNGASLTISGSASLAKDLTVAGPLLVKGTTDLSVGSNVLLMTDSNGIVQPTTTPSVAAIFATSTAATSTFAGALTVGGNVAVGGLQLVVDHATGNVGLGTTSPSQVLSVQGSGLFSGDVSVANLIATGTITIANNGTSTFRGDILARGVSAWQYLNAPFILATSTTATSTFSGGIAGANGFTVQQQSGWVGIGSTTPSQALAVQGNALFSGNVAVSSVTATGTIALMQTGTNALIIGDTTGNARGQQAVDVQSTRTGPNQVASGAQSVTMGVDNSSTQASSTAVGVTNVASGVESSAFGFANSAAGTDSTAVGWTNSANGLGSVALGYNNVASGPQSVAVGYNNLAGTAYASVFGAGMTNGNANSVVIGSYNGSQYGNVLLSPSGGSVGIGATTSPAATLGVQGNAYISGNLTVGGNSTTIGNASSDTLTIRSQVTSDIIPNQNNTYKLGSASFYWNDLYINNVHANNISAANTTIGGTTDNNFIINSDNASTDAESATLVFNRGTVVPNAVIMWDAVNKQFNVNQSTLFQNESTNLLSSPTIVVKGQAGQTGDLIQAASTTGDRYLTLTWDGKLGVGTTTPSQALSIQGNGLFSGNISAANITATGTIATAFASSTSITSTGYAAFATNGGSVGIGTTSPSRTLAVQGGAILSGDLAAANITATGTLAVTNLTVSGGTSYTGTGTTTFAGDILARGISAWQYLNAPFIQATSTTATSSFAGGIAVGSNALNVLQNGNVGIGNSSPGSKLVVSSGLSSTGISDVQSNATVFENGAGGTLGLAFAHDSVANRPIIQSISNGTAFSMSLNPYGGNIGIGTTTPTSILTIARNTSAAAMIRDTQANTLTDTGATLQLYGTRSDGTVGKYGEIRGYRSNSASNNAGYLAFGVSAGDGISNSEAMRIIEGGNVGIGTTSPISPLTVAKDQNANTIASLTNYNSGSGAQSYWQAVAGSAGSAVDFGIRGNGQADQFAYSWVESNIPYVIATNNSEKMRILANGNVGIGTTTPQSTLEVNGSGRFMGNPVAPTYGAGIELTYASNNGSIESIDRAGGGTEKQLTLAGSVVRLYSTPAGGEVMRVNSNGNVGIGTTNPGAKLEIASTTVVSPTNYYVNSSWSEKISAASINGSAGLALSALGSGGNPATASIVASPVADYRAALTATYSADTSGAGYFAVSQFSPNAATTFERMRIDANGNVGIGTSSPSMKLVVAGGAGSGTTVAAVDGGTSAGDYGMVSVSNGLTTKGRLVADAASNNFRLDTGGNQNGAITFLTGQTYNEAARIDSGGNVLVNTTTAGGKLFVKVGTNMDWSMTTGTSGLYPALRAYNDGASGYVAAQIDASPLLLNSASGANVGIGTTSPSQALSVQGNGLFSGSISAANITATGTIATTFASTTSITSTGYAAFATAGGNVGIGTANPGAKLEVNGSAIVDGATSVLSPANTDGALSYNFNLINTTAGSSAGLGSGIAFGQNITGLGNIIGLAGMMGSKDNGNASDYAGNLRFFTRTNGGSLTERMRIDSTGNVGIGTTTPGAALALSTVGNNGFMAAVTGSGKQYYLRGYAGTSNMLNIYRESTTLDATIDAAFSGGNLILNPSGGNVGIGNTSPYGNLTVGSGNSAFSIAGADVGTGAWIRNDGSNTVFSTNVGNMYFGYSGSANKNLYFMGGGTTPQITLTGSTGVALFTSNANGSNIQIQRSAGSQNNGLQLNDQAGTNQAQIRLEGYTSNALQIMSNSTNGIRFYTNTDFANSASPTNERMRIDGNGNVGIGTTSPASRFDVAGNYNDVLIGPNATSNQYNAISLTNSLADASRIGITGGASGDPNLYIDAATGGDLRLRTNGASEKVRITSGGFVGIGTTNPQEKLHVSGGGTAGTTYWSALFDPQGLNGASAPGVLIGQSSGVSAIQVASNGNLALNPTGGNVGIGTTSPAATLDVKGSAVRALDSGGALASYGVGTEMSYSASAGSGYLIAYDRGASTAKDLGLGASGAGITIKASGNVGIGTTTPAGQLDVAYAPGSKTGLLVEGSSASTNLANDSAGLQLVNWNTTANNYSTIAFGPTNAHFSSGITGVYTDHANVYGDLAFLTNSAATGYTEKLRITGGGNVGIGTTGPVAPLDVRYQFAKTDTTRRGIQGLYSNDASNPFGLSITSIGAAALANRTISFQTQDQNLANGGNLALQDSGGNVGVGTASPANKLHVVTGTAHSTTGNDTEKLEVNGVSGIGLASSLGFQVTQTNSQSARLAAIGSNFAFNWGGDMLFYTKPANGTPNDTVVENMRLTSAGNLGIGTSTPNVNLSIQGNSGSSAVAASIYNTANNSTEEVPIYLSANDTGGAVHTVSVGGRGDGSLSFRTGATALNTLGTIQMLINSGGGVGIGTTTPAQQVVIGGSGGHALAITSAAGADYILMGNQDSAGIGAPGVIASANGAVSLGHGTSWSNSLGGTITQSLLVNQSSGVSIGSYAASNIDPGAGNFVVPGNVGIGTNSPQAKLDVHTAFTGSGLYEGPVINVSSDNGSNTWSLGQVVGYVGAGAGNSTSGFPGGLLFKTKNPDGSANSAPTTKMALDANGNIGLGMTNPTARIDIASSTTVINTATALRIRNGTDWGGSGAYIDIGSNSWIGGRIGGIIINGSTGEGAMTFSTSANGSTMNEAMRIDKSGNLGVGTASPNVSSFGRAISLDSGNAGVNAGMEFNQNGTNRGNIRMESNGDFGVRAQTGALGIGTIAAQAISLYTNNSTAMTIGGNGLVGIGTTTPTAGLAVQTEGSDYGDGSLFMVNSTNAGFGGGATIAGIKSARTDSSTFNLLNIQNASGSKFLVRGDGNVGIGNTNPPDKLSVYSPGADHSALFTRDLSAGTFHYIGVGEGTGYVAADQAILGAKIVADGSTSNFAFLGMWGDDLAGAGAGLIVKKGGNVGIRTTAPNADLTVGTVNGTGSGGTGAYRIQLDGNVSNILGFGNGQYSGTTPLYNTTIVNSLSNAGAALNTMVFNISSGSGTVANNVLTLNGAGNVGIGTTSPYAVLSVVGPSGVVADKFNATSTVATSTFAGGLDVGNGSLRYDFTTGATSIANLEVGNTTFDSDSGIVTWADMPVTSASSAGTVESYTAGLNGNPMITVYGKSDGAGGVTNLGVGIGTNSPTNTLTIASTSANTLVANETGALTIKNLSTVAGNFAGLNFADASGLAAGGIYSQINQQSSGASTNLDADMLFATKQRANGGNPVERMRITSAGGVGIGTTTVNSGDRVAILGTTGGNAGMITFGDNGTYNPFMKTYKWTGSSNLYYQTTITNSLSSSGSLDFQTGGGSTGATIGNDTQTTRMTILGGSGNVGIGTTTPLGALTINQSTNAANAGAAITGTVDNVTLQLANYGAGGTGWWVDSTGGSSGFGQGKLVFGTANSAGNGSLTNPYVTFQSNGNVGIGTTSPGSLFSVAGNGYFTGSLGVGVANPSGERMSVLGNGARALGWGNTSDLGALSFSGSNAEVTALSGDLILGTDNLVDRVHIQASTGNVGIGATNPSQKLVVSPNSTMSFNLGGLANPVMAVGAYGANPSDGIGFFVHDTTSGYVGWAGAIKSGSENCGTYGCKTFRFQVPDAAGNALNALSIAGATGNVGINTTSPQAKLHVSGDGTYAGGIRLDRGAASDAWTMTVGGSGRLYFGYASTPSGGPADKIVFDANGNLGVSVQPTNKLDVAGGAAIGSYAGVSTAPSNGLIVSGTVGIGTNSPAGVFDVEGNNGNAIFNMGNGYNVSIGTTTPNIDGYGPASKVLTINGLQSVIELNTNSADAAGNIPGEIAFVASVGQTIPADKRVAAILANTEGTTANNRGGNIQFKTKPNNGTLAEAMRITAAGFVGIGTSSPASLLTVVGGGACFSGSAATAACGNTAGNLYYRTANTGTYDVAENYATTDLLVGAGDIVALDASSTLAVRKASAGDRVFGIVSTDPGMVLGGADASMMNASSTRPIALSGRVPVKVDGQNGAINVGDPITVSATPGVGMKALGSDEQIGIALESFSGGPADMGTIKVFVSSKQRYDASNFTIAENGNVGIGSTSPMYKLSVGGDIAATSFVNVSTRAAKTDISYLDDSAKQAILDQINSLNIAQYRYKAENQSDPLRLGLIAEEAPTQVLAVGGKGVDIYKLTTFALAGIQEQQKQINTMGLTVSSTTAQAAASNITIFDLVGLTKDQGDKITAILARLDTMDAQIASLSTTTAAVQTTLASLQTEIAALKAQVAAGSTGAASSTVVSAADASTTAATLASSTPFISAVANAIASGAAGIADWTVGKLTATVVYADRVEAKTVAVTQGFDITDQATGSVWCVTIKNGDWSKVPWACDTPASNVAAAAGATQTTPITQASTANVTQTNIATTQNTFTATTTTASSVTATTTTATTTDATVSTASSTPSTTTTTTTTTDTTASSTPTTTTSSTASSTPATTASSTPTISSGSTTTAATSTATSTAP